MHALVSINIQGGVAGSCAHCHTDVTSQNTFPTGHDVLTCCIILYPASISASPVTGCVSRRRILLGSSGALGPPIPAR